MRKHRKEQMVAAAFALFLAVAAASCSKPKDVEASKPVEPASATANQIPAIRTAKAETRSISASVQATGSFVAKESSDVAPLAPGRVSETPVDVGAFVQQGQIIARLEDQDLKLRLEQVTAAEQQAEAALRQAQSRIGLGQGEQFNPANVPEVLSAKATYDSAQAQAKQAEADVNAAKAQVKIAQINYGYANVYAAISGHCLLCIDGISREINTAHRVRDRVANGVTAYRTEGRRVITNGDAPQWTRVSKWNLPNPLSAA